MSACSASSSSCSATAAWSPTRWRRGRTTPATTASMRAVTSQFEQQARLLAGLPLGDRPACAGGDAEHPGRCLVRGRRDSGPAREPDWAAVLAHPGAKLHLYGKDEARRGRKMGHVTCRRAGCDAARTTHGRCAPLIAQLPLRMTGPALAASGRRSPAIERAVDAGRRRGRSACRPRPSTAWRADAGNRGGGGPDLPRSRAGPPTIR